MARIRCSFKAGKIISEGATSMGFKGELRLLGNGWRGLLIIAAAILWVYGLRDLGLIVMGIACIWSLVESIFRRWRRVCLRQKVLLVLGQGKIDEALEIAGEPEPYSGVWWRMLLLLFQQNRWDEAARWIDETDLGKERDYLLAVVRLGQGRPDLAFDLCPSKPQGEWLILKVQALFKMQEWHKVLGLLRGSSLRSNSVERLEQYWLKGGCYYFLGQFKPAVKLLRQVVEQGGEEYSPALPWLQQAIAKLK